MTTGLCVLTAAFITSMVPQQQTTGLLLIVRERIHLGAEAAYDSLEAEIAGLCARAQCPNPYLALQSNRSPTEVWWLNAFSSDADRNRVEEAYNSNQPLMTELLRLSRDKEHLTEAPVTSLVRYRPDLSENAHWTVLGIRFFVVTVTAEAPPLVHGVTFESPDREFFTFTPVADIAEGERLAARDSTSSVVLAIRPGWSFPAEDWIAADPAFWTATPMHHPPN